MPSPWGIDLSNFSGLAVPENLEAVVTSQNIGHITVAVEFEQTAEAWRNAADRVRSNIDGELILDSYRILYNHTARSYADQAYEASKYNDVYGYTELWLDVERPYAPPDAEARLRDAIQVRPAQTGVYTSLGAWLALGNPQLGSLVPLWDASWETDPGNHAVNYGGWLVSRGHQYAGNYSSYDILMDLSHWQE